MVYTKQKQTVGPNTPPAPLQSDQSLDPWENAKKAYGWLSDKGSDVVNFFRPSTPDLSGVKQAQERAFGTQDQLANERANYQGYYKPGWDTALGADQFANIKALQDSAAGRVPSPAELQLQRMAGLNAARQYSQAAALQGRNPGAALRSARIGALDTQAGTNLDAAVLRAKEQADARNQLIQALASARGQEQNLLGADIDWRKALLSGEIGALGAGGSAAGNEATAQANAAGARNQYKGSLLQGGGGIVAAL